jgi:hypothetical protein
MGNALSIIKSKTSLRPKQASTSGKGLASGPAPELIGTNFAQLIGIQEGF